LSNSALFTPDIASHGFMNSVGEYQIPPITKFVTTATASAHQFVATVCTIAAPFSLSRLPQTIPEWEESITPPERNRSLAQTTQNLRD
jgi:hypothetical protein